MATSCLDNILKHIGLTASAARDSNLVIGGSDVDWSIIRPGSYFRFSTDDHFYTIAKTSRIFFVRDFDVLAPNKITIKSDIGSTIQINDVLKLSYKEYELLTLFGIENGGMGYKVGDTVYIEEGSVVRELSSGLLLRAGFTVEAVDEEGKITGLSLVSKGRYLESPGEICNLSGGNGKGVAVNAEFRLLDERQIVERTVVTIDANRMTGNMWLDYPLPAGLKIGKLSVEKWQLHLTSPYLSETKISAGYEIARDFTPHLGLPLMVRGTLSAELTFNQSMAILDERVRRLEDKITDLTTKHPVVDQGLARNGHEPLLILEGRRKSIESLNFGRNGHSKEKILV